MRHSKPRDAGASGGSPEPRSNAEPESLIAELLKKQAELEVHQTELEMQNQALREAQAQVEETRDRYADLYDFAPIAYLSLDENGILCDVNLTAANQLGLVRKDAVGSPFIHFVARDHHGRFWNHMNRCRGSATQIVTALDLYLPRGVRVPAQLISAPARVSQKVPLFLTALVDLKEHILAAEQRLDLAREAARREEAERSNRAKDEFFSILAHELRTPLRAILGWIHLLSSGRLTPEERAHAAEVMHRDVQLQITLINDMLDVSRIVHGAIELKSAPVDMATLVTSVIEDMRLSAQQKALRLQVRVAPIPMIVPGDSDRLRQVMNNLLTNAVKSTPQGGRIEIELNRGLWTMPGARRAKTTLEDECVRFRVTDSGIGIAPEELPNIFDRFWSGRSGQGGGLGLGLAIVQRLTELHGGRMRAESRGPHQGSSFTIELPLDWTRVCAETNPGPGRTHRAG